MLSKTKNKKTNKKARQKRVYFDYSIHMKFKSGPKDIMI